MATKLKSYSKKLKSQVALSAHRGDKSLLEISTEYQVPKSNVRDWHKKLINDVENIFDGSDEASRRLKMKEKELEELYKLIGNITVENNYLKKKLDL